MNEVSTQPFVVRAIAPSDRERLACFYAALSPDSRAARFLGASPPRESTTHRLCLPDHVHGEGLIAEVVDSDGRRSIVGHLCLEPVEHGAVEMAIAVADAWQRHGIGRTLLKAGVGWAHQHGIVELRASMLWSNGAILGLVRSTGYPVTFGASDAGVLDMTMDVRQAVRHAA
jgi:GNAT superfamily N-acetyltransferase